MAHLKRRATFLDSVAPATQRSATFRRSVRALTAAALLAATVPSPASAGLHSVSGVPDPSAPNELTEVVPGGAKERVAYSLATGFPLWYEDQNELKLELCLDQQQVEVGTGTPFFPCLTAEPFLSSPVSFPTNFGPEAFYWAAVGFGTFTGFDPTVAGSLVGGDALIVMAQEAGFASGLAIDGNQAVFGRIRIRITVPFPGTYRVRHPYGEADYVVSAVAPGLRAINQTQDVGNLLPDPPAPPVPAGPPPAGDFTVALRNGPDPATVTIPAGYPAVSAGIVSSVATGIGPFLVAANPGDGPVTARSGATYLANPGTDLVPLPVRVTGGPFGDALEITLLDPPPGAFLSWDPVALVSSQTIRLDKFQLMGKVFEDRPNVRPIARDDFAATTSGTPVSIDVAANDEDVMGPLNGYGLNPQALGLPSNNPAYLPGTILLTRPLTTAKGTVRRFTDLATGKASFVYTPAAGQTGEDTFQYVVQDKGGLVSEPATVTVTIEDLSVARAEYRVRNGKWRISGTSSDATANAVILLTGPNASLAGASQVPAVSSQAVGRASLRLTPGAVEFRVTVDPLPSTAVTQVYVHFGQPGQNGPPILKLYDVLGEPAFTGSKRGTVIDAQRIFGPAQVQAGVQSFADVINAILAGNAYVNVRTSLYPAGELRGQLALGFVGTAPVDAATHAWTFTGKSQASPGGAPASVNVLSTNGVWDLGIPLTVK
jgi:hypothetical protein